MYIIDVDNVNQALPEGIKLMWSYGEGIESRAGKTLEVPDPVTTVYRKPWQRVLVNRNRDANPFFHLMEALWIIDGRQDVKFLTEFNARMADYSDDGKVFNAPYGYRLRNAPGSNRDQLASLIAELKRNPTSRQTIGQIWDANDLDKDTKDKACNMSMVFRIRNGKLCLTVYNRSNDMLWGAYGANVVQFSMLLEYVAASVGVPMGSYHQVSNSFHVYTEGPGGKLWRKLVCLPNRKINFYDNSPNLVLMRPESMVFFEQDMRTFFSRYDRSGISGSITEDGYISEFFKTLAIPMLKTYIEYKSGAPVLALKEAKTILADDWREACNGWILNRI